MKKISFIIRTYNEEKFIGRLLETIYSQHNPNQYQLEIIVVDNDSTDKTIDIAKNFDANIINIPRAEFNWGYALNLGIGNSTGELLIIISAHAIPVDNKWLEKIVSHFSDKKIGGVYCRQIAWPDAKWHEIYRLNHTFKEQSIKFSKNTPIQNMHFSNAASCIRRSLWEQYKFKILPAAEDRDWASWAINNGYEIYYEANAQIYHSHNESARYAASKEIEIQMNHDAVYNKKRNFFYTVLQANKMIINNSFKIITLEIGRKKIFLNMWDNILRNFWFVVDFNKVQKKINDTVKQHELK